MGFAGAGRVGFRRQSRGLGAESQPCARSTPNVYLYLGEQFDPDLGLYYQRARYLSTPTGRFWTMDEFAGNSDDPLSLHKYTYTEDTPANGTDPTGFDDLAGTLQSFAVLATLGAAALPLSAAFPILGVVLAGIGIASSGATAWQVFSNPGSSGGQKAASVFLIGLSLYGGAKTGESLWVNAEFLDTGGLFGSGKTGDMGYGLDYIRGRVSDFKDVLNNQMPNQKGRITIGVGVAEDSAGGQHVMIGTSEPRGYIRKPMKALLAPGDIIVKGTGHAEADIVRYSNDQGWNLIGVGATRGICTPCAQEIAGAGATAATPLKNPPQQ
jgi:RHS repeat-associated protein